MIKPTSAAHDGAEDLCNAEDLVRCSAAECRMAPVSAVPPLRKRETVVGGSRASLVQIRPSGPDEDEVGRAATPDFSQRIGAAGV